MKKDLISPAYDAVITSAYKYQNPMRDFIEPFLISPSYLFSNFFGNNSEIDIEKKKPHDTFSNKSTECEPDTI